MDAQQFQSKNQSPSEIGAAADRSTNNTKVRMVPRRLRDWSKSLVSTGIFFAVGLGLIAVLGAAQRLGWIQSGQCHHGSTGADAGGKNAVVYFCPMMCTPLRQSTPCRCPVCAMDLAVMKSGGGKGPQLSIEIDSAARRLANIQTVSVVSKRVRRTVRSIGKLAFDESRQKTICAYVDGRIEKLHVDFTGTQVREGDHMAFVYSPDLYSAQVEYLIARKMSKSQSASSSLLGISNIKLGVSSREKLIELGMTPKQIEQLEKTDKAQTRMQICAPMSGTVIEKLKREGEYVKTGEPIYRIADLSTVWLMLQLFPEDAAKVRYGQKVEAEVQSIPGEVFVGRVAFVDPFVSEKTRTVRVRVEILNSDRRLRPGDYATANVALPVLRSGEVYDPELAGKWISPRHPQVVCAEPGCCPLSGKDLVPTHQFGYARIAPRDDTVLVVPRNAVLMAGDQSIVYVETKPGKFEIRRVTLGPLSESEAVVYQGVSDGEKVVSSGNFLIDSQMQLAGNPSIIDPSAVKLMPPKSPSPKSGPLELQVADIRNFNGDLGTGFDSLYAAYFAIQKSLAADRKPSADQVHSLQSAAERLKGAPDLPKSTGQHVEAIVSSGTKLTDADLETIRKHFKPVSEAVLQLAARVRGPQTAGVFTHFYCPMVPGGGGDWLQADSSLLNPYFGSEMLKCGKQVRTLGVQKAAALQPGPRLSPTERR